MWFDRYVPAWTRDLDERDPPEHGENNLSHLTRRPEDVGPQFGTKTERIIKTTRLIFGPF